MNENQENQSLLSQTKKILTNRKNLDYYTLAQMLRNYLELLRAKFYQTQDEEVKRACVREDIIFLLPLSDNTLREYVDKGEVEYIKDFYSVWKEALAFAGSRSLEHFIEYMELDMGHNKKVFGNRRSVLKPFIYYLNKAAFDDKLKYVICSYPPSYGKTYTMNMFSAWLFGLDIDNSILRMSYSERNVNAASKAVKETITKPEFLDVFPSFKELKGKYFVIDQINDWTLNGKSNSQTSHFAITRDGSITGIRANKAIILDDMLKGADEALKEDLHNKYYDKWNNDWYNRRSSDDVIYVIAGTMWSPMDLINRIIDDRRKVTTFRKSKAFNKWVEESLDGSTVIIRVPLIEDGKCTCTHVMSNERALELQANDDPFLFSCVYMQDPIAPTGLEFGDEQLLHYTAMPADKDGNPTCGDYCLAALDPARKGKDNVSMPIFKTDGAYHYMIDCIFQKKAMTELYDEIVQKVIDNNIVKLIVENNTDTSLAALLQGKLEEKGYFLCEIIPKYSIKNKEQKIKDMRGIIKRKIIFKDKSLYTANSDYGLFMKNLTRYSFDYANKHDDAPDSLAMYAEGLIVGGGLRSRPRAISRADLGF